MSIRATKRVNATRWIRFRVTVVGTCFALFLGIIVGRAIHMQVLEGKVLSEKAEGQYKKTFFQRSRRGTIYDKNYKELAVSIDVPSICAYPTRIDSPQETALALAKALNVEKRPILQKLSSGKGFVWVKRQATPREERAIKELQGEASLLGTLYGIDFRTESRRVYPMRGLTAQLIGFCGIDGKGLEGLEYYYDSILSGSNSTCMGIRDALGQWFSISQASADSKDECNLVLTIDSNIQHIAERALSEGVERYSARSGTAVVMEPSTGAILAMAHVPQFNPNAFGQYSPSLRRNRAITDPFEPGSTFKVFVVAAALESGLCTPDSEFYCERGSYNVGTNVIHDIRAHDVLSVKDILKYSSNIGATKIGEKVGPTYLFEKIKAFGFGARSDVDCPGESPGFVLPPERWSDIDTRAICFGQGISVTALQLTAAVAAIANGGVLMKPYVLQGLTDGRGQVLKSFLPTKRRQVVSPETAQLLTQMLERVVTKGGSGVRAALRGYRIAGKTGTAQKVDPAGKGYADDAYKAAFVGFLPAGDPRLVILVVVDEPKGEHYGGVVAAPIFRQIALEALQYLKVPPDLVTPEEAEGSFRASRERLPVG